MRCNFFLACFIAAGASLAQQTETHVALSPHLYVGVLEFPAEAPEVCVVRVAFTLTEKGWESFPTDFDTPEALRNSFLDYPQTAGWVALYRGGQLGSVSSTRNDSVGAYSRVGLHKVGLECPISKIGEPTLDFAGWKYEPAYRPLLLCTRNASDPDSWKESTATDKERAGLTKHLRKVYTSTAEKWARTTIELGQVLASKKRNAKLFQVSHHDASPDATPILPATPETSVGDEPPASDDKVFFLRERGKFTLIGPKLTYLDAADFNGNGKSEIVFMLQAYNRDGYVLLGDRGGITKFTWNYH